VSKGVASDIEVTPVFDERNFNGVGHFPFRGLENPGELDGPEAAREI
jgi:hypothetical protein